MIRSFVGLGVPSDVAATLFVAQSDLPVGRMVPREHFHITLAFLGEHPEPVVEDAHLALDAIRSTGFSLSLAGVGLLGDARPRAVVADVSPEPGLSHLRRKVVQALRESGLTIDRSRYRPHVTLARLGTLGVEDRLAAEAFVARQSRLSAGPFDVTGFTLFESRLGREGPSYTVLADYDLAPATVL